MLTFVVPVRHQNAVRNWASLKSVLTITIRSLAAQKNGPWRAIIVANRGADLPDLPEPVEIVWVDLPPNALPYENRDTEAFYDAVRIDKGTRVLHGLVRGRAAGHVMVVDQDDMVSNRLAAFVASNPGSSGWFLDKGYVFSGDPHVFHHDWMFHKICGTSHVIRADLMKIPARVEDADDVYIRRWLGSHISIADDLQRQGTPLAPLPFTGAVYRIGHPEASSASPALEEFIERRNRREPHLREARLKKILPITRDMADEFFAGVVR